MVAVPHRHEHGLPGSVPCLCLVKERGHRLESTAHLLLRQEGSGNMSAAQHQICVIDHFSAGLLKRFDHSAVRIIDQDQNMGKLQDGSLPDLQSRRNPFHNGFLR